MRGTNSRPASALLLTIKRVYVDPLGKDSFSQQLRENLIRQTPGEQSLRPSQQS
jgi:hypothetical protein